MDKKTILGRMLSQLPDDVDKGNGSFVNSLLSVIASELEVLYSKKNK